MTATTTGFRPELTPDQVAREFHQLAAEWKDKSKYLSNNHQIAALRSYQRIIGLGRPVLPLILEELQREPRQWFWALEAITGVDPVPADDRGNVQRSADAWVAWGKQLKLIG